MARIRSSTTKSQIQSAGSQLRKALRTSAILTTLTGAVVTAYITPHITKIPMYTSKLTGDAYIQELLHRDTHPDRIHDTLGVRKHVFRALLRELQEYAGLAPTKYVSVEEQLAIFLRLARTGLGQREARERFQRSPDTVSRYVEVPLYCCHFSECYK